MSTTEKLMAGLILYVAVVPLLLIVWMSICKVGRVWEDGNEETSDSEI